MTRSGGRWAPTGGLAACLCLLPLASEATAQETLLERWTVGYVSQSWSPRWDALSAVASSESGAMPRFRVSFDAELLSFREALHRDQSSVSLGVRVPLNRFVGLRVSATSDAWHTQAGSRSLIETPRSQAAAVGADVDVTRPGLGRLRIEAFGGWDLGLGGLGRVGTSSGAHDVTVAAWRNHARESRVLLPADSLRDLGTSHVTTGGELKARVAISVAAVTLHPSLRWKREKFRATDGAPTGFLTASLGGSQTDFATELAVDAGAWRVGARYHATRIDLDSRIMRRDASAGTLPVVILDLWGWSAEASHDSGSRRWSLAGGSDRLFGELSARVETWPFVGVIEALSVQAYRLNVDMAARTVWLRVRNTRESGDGWSWGAEVGHYALHLDRDTWFVTSFGFGRRDREITATAVDPAVLVGGEASRRLTTALGAFTLRIQAGLPVYARTVDGGQGEGLAGYARLVFAWTR